MQPLYKLTVVEISNNNCLKCLKQVLYGRHWQRLTRLHNLISLQLTVVELGSSLIMQQHLQTLT